MKKRFRPGARKGNGLRHGCRFLSLAATPNLFPIITEAPSETKLDMQVIGRLQLARGSSNVFVMASAFGPCGESSAFVPLNTVLASPLSFTCLTNVTSCSSTVMSCTSSTRTPYAFVVWGKKLHRFTYF